MILNEGAQHYKTNLFVYSGGDALQQHVKAALCYLYPQHRDTVRAAVDRGGATTGLPPFARSVVETCRQYSQEAKDDEQVVAVLRLRHKLLQAMKMQYDADVERARVRAFTRKGRTCPVRKPPQFSLVPLMSSSKQLVPVSNTGAAGILPRCGRAVYNPEHALRELFCTEHPAFAALRYGHCCHCA